MKGHRPRNRNCHLTGPHNCCGQNRSKGKNWERGLQQEFPQLGRCGNSPCPERRACIASFSLMGQDLLFFPFRKMQNFVKCLRFPSHVRSLYQPLSRKRLTLVSFLGICSFTNEFIAASCSYKGLLLLLCYFLFQALLLRCFVSLVDY